jgi:peptide deformylase
MSLLEVRTIGDPVLEKKAVDVDVVDDEVRKLLDDMFETMRHEHGIGLAAPQIGVSRRVVTVEVGTTKLKMVNPVVTRKEGKSRGLEACLSVPDVDGEVERADHITCEYLDENGEKQSLEAEGLLARCIQHECDHLDGVLFVTRVSPARRMMIKKRVKELRQATKERIKLAARG